MCDKCVLLALVCFTKEYLMGCPFISCFMKGTQLNIHNKNQRQPLLQYYIYSFNMLIGMRSWVTLWFTAGLGSFFLEGVNIFF